MPDFDKEFPPLGATMPSGKESKEPDEEWELLTTDDEDHAENDISSTGEEEVQMKRASSVVVHGNPKILRHCTSSPNLRCFAHVFEEDDDDEEHKVEDSSYAMVSNVGSVISMSSSGRSFRDAFLSSPIHEDKATTETDPITATNTAPRPYRKAKMVVIKPPSLIRRCSKSSPNLLGLIHEDLANNVVDDQEGEILGDTDAAEYYHRKSKGAQGRSNGLKLRPDEAKRKAYAVNKRNLQRQASGAH